ncbi:MAG: hypothetical protein A2896_01205 [Candidatus Nealsonbacteria bacterium RIFCSPLOWO2_01_FULL_43_32]|uniref:DNA ligase n=1 Tax=Candidatus Nealsonbacteria bacterium RIFCSPLOWO2_01_FULL_43_32 TaxID=1801672 RepID=A0A1G2EF50_9BACT|nr:MAG: hypothetical protein A2896_01205 [Candidatus Nealsonbacteria bacterium RIFCSPLOWO2_01_FULL_43_32]
MTKQQAKQRIEKLKKVINHHRYLYHVLDRQEISDAALDSLKHELYQLEQQYKELITQDSPTQRVGGKAQEGFQKVGHKIPMLSIEDIFSEQELTDWENYLKRLVPGERFEYFCEPKIDGFAVTLIYQNGIFKTGATRGSGTIGEDVTQNLKTIESIPLRLRVPPEGATPSGGQLIEVRGEVYMEKKDFEKFNKGRIKKDLPPYANPRNLAAGSIRQLDPQLASQRPLKFLAYSLITSLGQKKHSQEHQILRDLGFRAENGQVCATLFQVVDFWREIHKKRDNLPFQIDGVVAVVNNNALFQKLGVVGKSPRAIRAFKFSAKQATTKIKDIKVQVGRTGAITPVAVLEPVMVGGVTISRATLHNEDEIKRLGVKINDTVIVERAGDVIPAVTQVLKGLRTGQERGFPFPKICPVCGSLLEKPAEEKVWRCPNSNCQAKKRQFLYHFVSKKAFDIKGLGLKIIDQLVDENLVSQPSDLFELQEGDLLPLERFGQKSAANLISAIRHSQAVPLSRFIYALSIRHVGEETALILAQHFGNSKRLQEALEQELQSLSNIGVEVSKSVYHWFQNKRNMKMVDDLLAAGVKIIPSEKPLAEKGKLAGKNLVITGVLDSMTRVEAHQRIRLLGGHPLSSVSKKTDFLVVGANPSSKVEKARELGVKTINEKEFLKLVQ